MRTGVRILLVDHHHPRREATKYLLEKDGYHVTPAKNCAKARNLLWQDFELLMIDCNLHHRNGGNLARAWQELHPAGPVLLSGSLHQSKPDDVTAATPLGLPIERLLSAIDELMGVGRAC
jgi:DNA-binding response OmpR family regulator